jgi:CheY-like chemotaxis protein
MPGSHAHVLVVDDAERTLSIVLGACLEGHEMEVAKDAFDAIYRIDCAASPFDVIFCDLARGDLPGPELWAYLALTRSTAAQRMVFVASAPLQPDAQAFLRRIPNRCVGLPLDADAIDTLAICRASCSADREPEAVRQ